MCLCGLTSSAIEVKEASTGEVYPLLALAVVVQGDLLSLHANGGSCKSASADLKATADEVAALAMDSCKGKHLCPHAADAMS